MTKKYNVFFLTHLVKFQLKTPPMHGEMKGTNRTRGNYNQRA